LNQLLLSERCSETDYFIVVQNFYNRPTLENDKVGDGRFGYVAAFVKLHLQLFILTNDLTK